MAGRLARSVAASYAEAEYCVANARKTQAVELNLAIAGLERIPPLLDLPALRSVRFSNTPVRDLTPLSGLVSLQLLSFASTAVSDLTPLKNLTDLRWLGIAGTLVSDLAPLAHLTSLRGLSIAGLRVRDLTPLANLTMLQSLNLSNTLVSDLRPLSGLAALQSLELDGTIVSDLAPLASLTALLKGAQTKDGLSFARNKLEDKQLRTYLTLPNPGRTIKTINYLREQQGMSILPPSDSDDLSALSPLELSERLRQNPNGTKVIVAGDQLALAPSGNESDTAAANDPAANQLHIQLNRKVRSLREFAERVRNQPGWTDLADDADAFRRLAEMPLVDIAQRIAEFWSLSGSLGAYLAQDDEAERRKDAMVSRLEPDGRRILGDVVINAATLTRLFPTAVKLDLQLREALHKPERIEPAKAAVEIAGNTELLWADHVSILYAALTAPNTEDAQTRKAHDRSVRTTRNVVFGALVAGGIFINAGIAEGYLDEIGGEIARHDILARRIEDFVVKGEKDIADLLDGEPADKKAAVKEMIRRIKNKDAAPPGRQGKGWK